MKRSFFALVPAFLASTAAFACPNLSGIYKSQLPEGMDATVTIIQHGCESLEATLLMKIEGQSDITTSMKVITDGIYRNVEGGTSSTKMGANYFTERSAVNTVVYLPPVPYPALAGSPTILAYETSETTVEEDGSLLSETRLYAPDGKLISKASTRSVRMDR